MTHTIYYNNNFDMRAQQRQGQTCQRLADLQHADESKLLEGKAMNPKGHSACVHTIHTQQRTS